MSPDYPDSIFEPFYDSTSTITIKPLGYSNRLYTLVKGPVASLFQIFASLPRIAMFLSMYARQKKLRCALVSDAFNIIIVTKMMAPNQDFEDAFLCTNADSTF